MDLPEQIYQDLQNSLPQLQEAIKTGTVYATELGHKIIQWDIAKNITMIIILLFVGIIVGFLIKRVWKAVKTDTDMKGFLLFLGGGELIIIIIFFCSLFAIIEAVFVPELRIVEILQNLLS